MAILDVNVVTSAQRGFDLAQMQEFMREVFGTEVEVSHIVSNRFRVVAPVDIAESRARIWKRSRMSVDDFRD